MNCKDMNKWSTDIVAIVPSFVESEKGCFVTILEIKAFLREICEASITLLQCIESSPVSCMVILATSLVLIVFGCCTTCHDFLRRFYDFCIENVGTLFSLCSDKTQLSVFGCKL